MNKLVRRSLEILGKAVKSTGADYTSNLTSFINDAKTVRDQMVKTGTDVSDTIAKLKTTDITKKISDWFYQEENSFDASQGDEFDAGFSVNSSDDAKLDGEKKPRQLDFEAMTEVAEKQSNTFLKIGRRQTEQSVANTGEIISVINSRTSEMSTAMNNINKTLIGISDRLDKLIQIQSIPLTKEEKEIDKGDIYSDGKLSLARIFEQSKKSFLNGGSGNAGLSQVISLIGTLSGVGARMGPEELAKLGLGIFTGKKMDSLGGKSIDELGHKFNDMIGAGVQTALNEMINTGPFKALFGDITKMEAEVDYGKIVPNKYDNKKALFDGMVHQSIVTIIPEMLEKINESISGTSYHLDNRGNWQKGPVKNEFKEVGKQAVASSGLTQNVISSAVDKASKVTGQSVSAEDIEYASRALSGAIVYHMYRTGQRSFSMSMLKGDMSVHIENACQILCTAYNDPLYWSQICQTVCIQLSMGILDSSKFLQNINQSLKNLQDEAARFAQSGKQNAKQASKISLGMIGQALYEDMSPTYEERNKSNTQQSSQINNQSQTNTTPTNTTDGRVTKDDNDEWTVGKYTTAEYVRSIFGILNRGINVKVVSNKNKGFDKYNIRTDDPENPKSSDDKFARLFMQMGGVGDGEKAKDFKGIIRQGISDSLGELTGSNVQNVANAVSGGGGFMSTMMGMLGGASLRSIGSKALNGTLISDFKGLFAEGGRVREMGNQLRDHARDIRDRAMDRIPSYDRRTGQIANAIAGDDGLIHTGIERAREGISSGYHNARDRISGFLDEHSAIGNPIRRITGTASAIRNNQAYQRDSRIMTAAQERIDNFNTDAVEEDLDLIEDVGDRSLAELAIQCIKSGDVEAARNFIEQMSEDNKIKQALDKYLQDYDKIKEINKKREDGQNAIDNGETPGIGAVIQDMPSSSSNQQPISDEEAQKKGGILGVVARGFGKTLKLTAKITGAILKLSAKLIASGTTDIIFGAKNAVAGMKEIHQTNMKALKTVGGFIGKATGAVKGFVKKGTDRVKITRDRETNEVKTLTDLIKSPLKTLGTLFKNTAQDIKNSGLGKSISGLAKKIKDSKLGKAIGDFKKKLTGGNEEGEGGLFSRAGKAFRNTAFGAGFMKARDESKAAQAKMNEMKERTSSYINRTAGNILDVLTGKAPSGSKSAFQEICDLITSFHEDVNNNHEEDIAAAEESENQNATTTDENSTVNIGSTEGGTTSTPTSTTVATTGTEGAGAVAEGTAGAAGGGGILGGIGKMLGGITTMLGGIFKVALGVIMGMETIQAIINTLQEALKQILKPLEKLFKLVKKIIDSFIKPIKKTLKSIMTNIVEVLTTIIKKIQPLLQVVSEVIDNIFKKILQPLLAAFMELLSDIMDIMMPILDIISSILDEVLNKALIPIMEIILDSIMKIFTPIMDKVVNVLVPIIEMIGGAVQTISGILQICLGVIIGIIGNILKAIGTFVSGFGAFVVKYTAFNKTGEKIEDAGDDIQDTADSMMSQADGLIASGWKELIKGLKIIGSSAIEGVKAVTGSEDSSKKNKKEEKENENDVNTNEVNVGTDFGAGDVNTNTINNSWSYTYGSGNTMNQHTYGNYMNMSERGCGPVVLADAFNRRNGGHMNPASLASSMMGSGAYEPSRGTSVRSMMSTSSALGMNTRVGGVTQSSLKQASPTNPITLLGSGAGFGTKSGNSHYVNVVGTDSHGGAYVSNPMSGRVERQSLSQLALNSKLGLYGSGDIDLDAYGIDEDSIEALKNLKALTGKLTTMFTGSASDDLDETIKANENKATAKRIKNELSEDEYNKLVDAGKKALMEKFPKKDGETDEDYELRINKRWEKEHDKYIVENGSESAIGKINELYDSIRDATADTIENYKKNQEAFKQIGFKDDRSNSETKYAYMSPFSPIKYYQNEIDGNTSGKTPLHNYFSATSGSAFDDDEKLINMITVNGGWYGHSDNPDKNGVGADGKETTGVKISHSGNERLLVRAITPGTVVAVTDDTSPYGRSVKFKDEVGMYHWYMNLAAVDPGIKVNANLGENAKIGLLGYEDGTKDYTLRDDLATQAKKKLSEIGEEVEKIVGSNASHDEVVDAMKNNNHINDMITNAGTAFTNMAAGAMGVVNSVSETAGAAALVKAATGDLEADPLKRQMLQYILTKKAEGEPGEDGSMNPFEYWEFVDEDNTSTALSGNTEKEQIFNYLVNNIGFTEKMAAGIMGVWNNESTNVANTLEGNYAFPDKAKEAPKSNKALNDYTENDLFPMYARSGVSISKSGYKGGDGNWYPGFGLAQWTGPRGKQVLDYAKSKNKDWTQTGTQLAFVADEMNGDYSYIKKDMLLSKTVQEAADIWMSQYEAGHKGEKNPYNTWLQESQIAPRRSDAEKIYNELKGLSKSSGKSVSSSVNSSESDSDARKGRFRSTVFIKGTGGTGDGYFVSKDGVALANYGTPEITETNITSSTSNESPLHEFFSKTTGGTAMSWNGNWYSQRSNPDSSGTGSSGDNHGGIDFWWSEGSEGQELHATCGGTVDRAEGNGGTGGCGNNIRWLDDAGYLHWYMHMQKNPLFNVGDTIEPGALVGYAGNTGDSQGAHLHYNINDPSNNWDGWAATNSLNPLTYFCNYNSSGGGSSVVNSSGRSSSDDDDDDSSSSSSSIVSSSSSSSSSSRSSSSSSNNSSNGSVGYVSTNETGLNMRSKANTDSDIITVIPKGGQVEILAEKNGWYKVKYNSKTGFVKKDYITRHVSSKDVSNVASSTANAVTSGIKNLFNNGRTNTSNTNTSTNTNTNNTQTSLFDISSRYRQEAIEETRKEEEEANKTYTPIMLSRGLGDVSVSDNDNFWYNQLYNQSQPFMTEVPPIDPSKFTDMSQYDGNIPPSFNNFVQKYEIKSDPSVNIDMLDKMSKMTFNVRAERVEELLEELIKKVSGDEPTPSTSVTDTNLFRNEQIPAQITRLSRG